MRSTGTATVKKTSLFCGIIMLMFSTYIHGYSSSPAISLSGQSNVVIDGLKITTGTNGAAIYLTNCTNIKITNCFLSLYSGIIGVRLANCSNIEISGCYIENFNSGVYATGCTGGINIHCNQFNTIAGTKPRGQMVQFNGCSGTGNRVNYNTLDTPVGVGGAEDLINMYNSSGTTSDPIQINGNQLRGGGPSTSGGGIMLGDNGSHDLVCDGNILVDPGQYGISSPSGYNVVIKNNKVYSSQYAWSNVGIYVGVQSEIDAGFTCNGPTIQVLNNKVNWTNKNGIKNGWYPCPCCPGVVQSGNNFNDPAITSAILPAALSLNSTYCGGAPAPTAANTPAATKTFTPAATKTNTPAPTKTFTPVPTNTATPANTRTFTPVNTSTTTQTVTKTATQTSTATADATKTFTPVSTTTMTPVDTFTATPAITPRDTFTPSATPTSQAAFTETPAVTYTSTASSTATQAITATFTATATSTLTATAARAMTAVPTATASAAYTATAVIYPAATATYTEVVHDEKLAFAGDDAVSVYPNPAAEGSAITIRAELLSGADGAKLVIYTVSGRLIRSFVLNGNYSPGKNFISVSGAETKGLGAGTYYYNLSFSRRAEHISRKGVILILRR